MAQPGDITALLIASSNGNREALDQLVPLVYDQLRALARRRLRAERRDHTLDTIALVNEAYLKLVDLDRLQWKDRTHFFAMASRLMRRILVDYAHRRNAGKREGGRACVPLTEAIIADTAHARDDILAINEALERLEPISPRGARAIEYRYFGGLSLEETAAALGVSAATAKRDLRFAQAWLVRTLTSSRHDGIRSTDTDRGPVSRDRGSEPRQPRRSP